MNLEDFQIIYDILIDNSIIQLEYLEVYHQQGTQLIDGNQGIDFLFDLNSNYNQIGNG